MPLETTLTNVSPEIKPLSSQEKTSSTKGVRTKGDETASPFAPKTNVNIKNAVSDMAGILARIASIEENATEKMPDALKEMINNIMKQAFSLEETLQEGISSTVESQRFVADQLTIMARILARLANLAEKGLTSDLSEDLQVFLSELKKMLTAKNSTLEPGLLHKFAFKLLAQKDTNVKIPPEMRAFLGSSASEGENPEALKTLKKLLDILLPLKKDFGTNTLKAQIAEKGDKMTAQGKILDILGKEIAQNGEANAKNRLKDASIMDTLLNSRDTLAKDFQKEVALAKGKPLENLDISKQEKNISENTKDTNKNTQTNSTPSAKNTPTNATEANAQNSTNPKANLTGSGEKNPPLNMQENMDNVEQREGENLKNLDGSNKTSQGTGEKASDLKKGEQFLARDLGTMSGRTFNQTQQNETPLLKKLQSYTQYNDLSRLVEESMTQGTPLKKEEVLPTNMKHTPELTKTMQSLADLILKDSTLSEKDISLLKNFVSKSFTQLSDSDARQLQLLLRICQQNVPASVQYVAMHKNMTDLPRLWAFVQLCDIVNIKEQTPRNLKNASKNIINFVSSMRHMMSGDTSSTIEGERSLQFMTPLYVGEGTKKYPAYINIYDEEKPSEETGELQKETWFRVCLLTDYAGAVELTCRLYEKQKLNIRLFFSEQDAVDEFQKYVSEFKQSFFGTRLELTDLKIGTLGTKVH